MNPENIDGTSLLNDGVYHIVINFIYEVMWSDNRVLKSKALTGHYYNPLLIWLTITIIRDSSSWPLVSSVSPFLLLYTRSHSNFCLVQP
jgi:hypothetical protein